MEAVLRSSQCARPGQTLHVALDADMTFGVSAFSVAIPGCEIFHSRARLRGLDSTSLVTPPSRWCIDPSLMQFNPIRCSHGVQTRVGLVILGRYSSSVRMAPISSARRPQELAILTSFWWPDGLAVRLAFVSAFIVASPRRQQSPT